MDASSKDSKNQPIKVIKLVKGDYTHYNSCERQKKEGYKPNHNHGVKQLNVFLTNDDHKKQAIDSHTDKHLTTADQLPLINPFEDQIYSKHNLERKRDRKTEKQRGRQLLEKHKKPKDRLSRKFFSEEKYHYSQNLQIEEELRQFKMVRCLLLL